MNHRVVTRDEWLEARAGLLAKERELTRAHDDVSRARRALPWVRVEKSYSFEGPKGRETLSELFEGRSQLVIYHFMFGPDWEAGCKSCSFWADSFDGIPAHLAARDVTFLAVSRAPFPKLQAFQRRLGWSFKWVSSFESDFNFDYQVSWTKEDIEKGEGVYNYEKHEGTMTEKQGISVFAKDEAGAVFHTYSCYARGVDGLNVAYQYLDLVPKGRDEEGLSYTMAWVRHRDRYAR